MENEGLKAIQNLIALHEAEIKNWEYLIEKEEKENPDNSGRWKWKALIKETEPKLEVLRNQAEILGPCKGC